jgi:nitrate/nitrite transporter NarK
MYVADSRAATQAQDPPRPGARAAATIAPAVFALGAVSLITDISSEMITAVLPLYLVTELGLSPLGFGVLDGVYNGFSALVRLVGGHLADRRGHHKTVAAIGYSLSAVCKPLLLVIHSLPLIGAVLATDRTGKGLRTAPRDALISLASDPETHGRAFGVHRAMDTAGALLGPLVAFVILRQAAEGYDAVFTVSTCVAVIGVLVLLLFVPSTRNVTQGRTSSRLSPTPSTESASAESPSDMTRSNPSPSETAPSDPSRFETASSDSSPSETAPPGPSPSDSSASSLSAPAQSVPASSTSIRAALALLHRRDLRRLAACALLLGLATISDSFVYLVLQRRFSIPTQWFALMPLGTAAAFLTLTVPLGRLADRVGRWRVFLAGHAALLAAYGLLLTSSHSHALPYVVLALHGSFYAATDGVLMAAAATTVPARLRSSGLAIVQTGQAGARFACSLAFGAAWTAWGDHTALTVAALALATAVATTMWLRPAERRSAV